MPLWVAAAVVLIANVPFGYWRSNARKFSSQWALAIHIPVALAVLLRLIFHLPFDLTGIALMAAAFFLGQCVGQEARRALAPLLPPPLTSCLLCDLARAFRG